MYTQADTLGRHYCPASDVACASGGRSGHTAPAGGEKAATHVRGGGKPLDRDTAQWKPRRTPACDPFWKFSTLPGPFQHEIIGSCFQDFNTTLLRTSVAFPSYKSAKYVVLSAETLLILAIKTQKSLKSTYLGL